MFKCVTLSLWLYYFISIAQGGADADTLRGAQFKVYAFNVIEFYEYFLRTKNSMSCFTVSTGNVGS